MSGKVGSVTVDSSMVENVGVAVGISTISPEKHSTSGLESAILKHVVSRRRAMSDKVGGVTIHGRKCGGSRWKFGDISLHSGDTMYFRFEVRHLEFWKSADFQQ